MSGDRIIRVFPRRTAATPQDEYAYVGNPPLFWPQDATQVHVSCTFTWDVPEAHRLAQAWQVLGLPVLMGGPAFGDPGGEFVPGRYLRPGYTITSRGCPNRCRYCYVPKREGALRLLEIKPGHIVADNNLLACPEDHFDQVCKMLRGQREHAVFTGGLEARRLTPYHAEWLWALRPDRLYFAYDRPGDLEHLMLARQLLEDAGFRKGGKHRLCCYVLIGHKGDTLEAAERRLRATWAAGYMPFAMLWAGPDGLQQNKMWRRLQRDYARPGLTAQVLAAGGDAI